MKKFVVIAVIAAFTAGVVSAQELKLDGYFNSGLGLVTVGDNATVLKPFGVDSEQNGYRFRLNGSYQNEAKTAGFRFRFQSQSTLAAGYLSLPYAYGWVSFLDNVFNLSAGIVDDSTWTTADWWINDDVGEGLGALLKIAPFDGLILGFGAYLANQNGSGDNNTLAGVTAGFGSVVQNVEDVKYVISGSFNLPNAFRLGASFRTENKAGNGTTRHESSALFADLRILAVKNLTAVIAGSFDNLQDFGDSGNIVISETFAYKATDEFNIGLDAVQFLYNRSNDRDPSLLFRLWGSYAIESVVPRIDLTYFIGGRSNTSQQYHRRGFANVNAAANADDDYSVFSVRPSIRFNLDSRTFFEIGDVMHFESANFDAWDNERSQFINVFYIDVKWSF